MPPLLLLAEHHARQQQIGLRQPVDGPGQAQDGQAKTKSDDPHAAALAVSAASSRMGRFNSAASKLKPIATIQAPS